MRAVVLGRTGDPSVLSVGEAPEPGAPAGDEVLVRVASSSVNGTDLGLRAGGMAAVRLLSRRLVLGFDVAGEVVACGPSVTAFAPGDTVMALLGHGGGGQAELVRVPQARAAMVPAGLAVVHAGAVPLAGLTALQALRRHARLQDGSGRRVLVVGAAGGIGSWAVQLARVAGAHVAAVTSAGRDDHVRDLGAHEVLDRHRDDPYTADARWDVVLDCSGTLAFDAVRGSLGKDGVMVSTRPVSPESLRALAAGAARRGGPRFAAVMTAARTGDLDHLARLVAAGQVRVPVDRVLPLEQVAAAHAHAASSAVRGKVVLTP